MTNEVNFQRSFFQVIQAIENSLSSGMILPALILIYTAIDSASWLACDDDEIPTSRRFKNWVNNWMLSRYPLPCTADELYLARCGVLHTLTPETNHGNKKRIRKIAYAWGKAKQGSLEKAINIVNAPNVVALHLDDLLFSFRNGFVDYLEYTDQDEKAKKIYNKKIEKYYGVMDISAINEFIENYESQLSK